MLTVNGCKLLVLAIVLLLIAATSQGAAAQTTKLGPSGGSGGTPFEFKCPGTQYITEMHVRAGQRIDRIGILCSGTEHPNQFGGGGGTANVFRLDPNERLRGIRGTVGKCGKDTRRVCSLRFVTTERQSQEFGRPGTQTFEHVSPTGEATGLFGRAGREIDAIGILARPSQ